MEVVFIKLFNMSISAGWLILAVVPLRFIFRKAPKSISCILWALVAVRLVCPFLFESVFSMIPSAETVSPDILYAETPEIHSGISAFNTYVNPVISQSLTPAAGTGANQLQMVSTAASIVWMSGMAAMMLYGVIGYAGLRRKVAEAVPLRGNLWQSQAVASPFVLGFFHPRIYLPFGMEEKSMAYAVAHENAHISRRDHWIKPVGFLLLTIYWFNPLIWLAYALFCRDIEFACDERVIKRMGADDKKAYSEALLDCSIRPRSLAPCPPAFGEAGVRQRIKNVLNYKKPAFLVIAAALVSCAALGACFLTNPQSSGLPAKDVGEYDAGSLGGDSFSAGNTAATAPSPAFGGIYSAGALLAQNGSLSYLPEDGSYYAQIILSADSLTVINNEGETVFESGGSKARRMTREALIEKLGEANLYGMAEEDVPEYDSPEDMTAYSYYPPDGGEKDIQYGIYWFNGEPGWFVQGEMLRIYRLEPAAPVTTYISQSCIYMNPLSSYYPFHGDSGYRYLMGKDSFAIVDKETEKTVELFTDIEWNWQDITGREWAELFSDGAGAPDVDIEEYAPRQTLGLSDKYRLLEMSGRYWIMEMHENTKMGTFVWSIYQLTPA